jgi:hypothetical protein
MHTSSDPYAELGVPHDATPAQITHAFRQLLRRHHPDTRESGSGADADSALQRILNAYAALHDGPTATHRRPQATASSVDSRTPAADSPIRAGPIRWTTDRRR